MMNSYIHRLNVISKLLCFLYVIVAVFLFNHPLPLVVMLAFMLALILPSKISLKGMMDTLGGLKLIFILIVVMSLFTARSETFVKASSQFVLFKLFKKPATLGGLLQGLTFMLRIFIMVLATCTFTITTPIDDLLSFLNKVHAPYELSIVVATAISFVPTLMNKKDLILQAQKARGADIRTDGGIRQLMAYIPIMVPLVTNSILMADSLSISMTNRGYGANKAWTDMNESKMGGADYFVIVEATLIMVLCFLLRYMFKIGQI